MFEIVYEFVVKDEFQGQFELSYGPGGAWSKLFSRSEGFRGTTVHRDTKNPQRYLVIDLWDTADQREQALDDHKTEYAHLQSTFDAWTESRTEVGIFRIQGKATVRPYSKSRRKITGVARRGRRH